MLPDAQRWLARTVDSFKERPSPLQASLLAPSSATPQLRTRSVLLTAAPLLLAIAGSALTPLPCAFSLAGVSGGTLLLIAIAIANDYTSVIMVRSASRLGGTGYEEVVLAAGGRRALLWCRVALVLLLFGTMCGCLAAIQECGMRALSALHSHALADALDPWLLIGVTACVLLPLSLASLGDWPLVAVLGVTMEVCLAIYVVYRALNVDGVTLPDRQTLLRTPGLAMSQGAEAASTFGYAFYVQPCAVPLLRTLPRGDDGARTLCAALHVTFAVTCVAYLCVGLGGLIYFGEGAVPQDLLQGFDGPIGGSLAAFFSVYLMLAFSPTLVPLRETLVRLHNERTARSHAASPRPPEAPMDATDAVLPPLQNAALTTALISAALSVALLLPNASASLFALTGATGVCAIGYAFPVYAYWRLPPEFGGGAAPTDGLTSRAGEAYNPLATPTPRYGGRPPWLQSLNQWPFFSTSSPKVSPQSSPALRPMKSPTQLPASMIGGVLESSPKAGLSVQLDAEPRDAAASNGAARAPALPPLPPQMSPEAPTHAKWLRNALIARVWPASVLLLGTVISILTLLSVFEQWAHNEQHCSIPDDA